MPKRKAESEVERLEAPGEQQESAREAAEEEQQQQDGKGLAKDVADEADSDDDEGEEEEDDEEESFPSASASGDESDDDADGEAYKEINVEFEFFDPKENDFHGLKTLLHSYLDGQQYDCSGLVDAIIKQVGGATCRGAARGGAGRLLHHQTPAMRLRASPPMPVTCSRCRCPAAWLPFVAPCGKRPEAHNVVAPTCTGIHLASLLAPRMLPCIWRMHCPWQDAPCSMRTAHAWAAACKLGAHMRRPCRRRSGPWSRLQRTTIPSPS